MLHLSQLKPTTLAVLAGLLGLSAVTAQEAAAVNGGFGMRYVGDDSGSTSESAAATHAQVFFHTMRDCAGSGTDVSAPHDLTSESKCNAVLSERVAFEVRAGDEGGGKKCMYLYQTEGCTDNADGDNAKSVKAYEFEPNDEHTRCYNYYNIGDTRKSGYWIADGECDSKYDVGTITPVDM